MDPTMSMRVARIVCTAGAVLVLASPGRAAELHVAADGSGAYATIGAALDASEADDEIVLGDGTFQGEGNRDLWMPDHSITIRSESGDPSRTIVDCGGTEPHHFLLSDSFLEPSLTVEGVSFTGVGRGCLSVTSVSLTIRRSWFYGNTGPWAIIECGFAPVVIEETVIVGNSAAGATLVVVAPLPLTMTGCTVAHNDGTEMEVALPFASAGNGGATIDRTVIWDPCEPIAVGVYGLSATISRSVVDPERVGGTGDVSYPEDPITSDPRFCDPLGCDAASAGPGDYTVAADSPCRPDHNPWGVPLDALGLGCDATPVLGVSWSDLKSRHSAGQ